MRMPMQSLLRCTTQSSLLLVSLRTSIAFRVLAKTGLATAVFVSAAVAQPAGAACPAGGILGTVGPTGQSQIMLQEFYAGAAESPSYPGAWYSWYGPPFDSSTMHGVWWAIGRIIKSEGGQLISPHESPGDMTAAWRAVSTRCVFFLARSASVLTPS